jgi:hypothetical protein
MVRSSGGTDSLNWSGISEPMQAPLLVFDRNDDSRNMIDRILYAAALALRSVEHWMEKYEERQQWKQLEQWREFIPAPAKARMPVRVVEISRH